MKLRRLATRDAWFEAELAALTRNAVLQDPAVQESVRAILADVRVRGDEAVLDYTRKFDRIAARSLAELEVPKEKLRRALEALPREQAGALREAGDRIRDFHQRLIDIGRRSNRRIEPGHDSGDGGAHDGELGGATRAKCGCTRLREIPCRHLDGRPRNDSGISQTPSTIVGELCRGQCGFGTLSSGDEWRLLESDESHAYRDFLTDGDVDSGYSRGRGCAERS